MTPEELGFGLVERELFAVYEDEFAAFDTVHDGVTARVIEVIDDTLRFWRIGLFGPGSTAECHEFFSTQTAPAPELPFRRFGEAIPLRTFPADLLSDDFAMVDHRSIGLGTPDRAAYLDSVEALRTMGGLVFRRSVIRSAGRHACARQDGVSGSRRRARLRRTLTLMICDAEHLTRMEHFDIDDVDAAIARSRTSPPDRDLALDTPILGELGPGIRD